MLGFAVLLLAFVGFGGWAAVAKLGSAAVAPGMVTVESYRKTIQHLEGGIIKEIRVRDGDTVTEGQVLVRLEDTQPRAQLEIVRSGYLALRALEVRLIAERDNLERIVFPNELVSLQDDPRVRETLNGQDRVFKARRDSMQGEIAVLEQRIEQLQAQISGLDALQQSEKQRIDSLNGELQDFRKLLKEGHVDKLRVLDLERSIAALEGDRAEHLADMARAKMQIGETRLQIMQVKKKFLAEVVAELRDVQTKIFDAQERMRALRDTLERTEIRASNEGIVVGLGVHTVGGVISPGTRILDIVPRGEPLVVEAQVQPTDIDKVHPGLTADIRFSAFKARTTPVVEGKVLTVSADRLIDQADKRAYYLARIEVTPEGMAQLHGLQLLPGMPAEVIIKTGERTFLEYLLQPLLDSFARSFKEE